MPLLPHPLDEALRKAATPPPSLALLCDLVIALRAWKAGAGIHQAHATAAEFHLTQAAVALLGLSDLHHAAAKKASHRDSIGSIYQFDSATVPSSVSKLGPPQVLSQDAVRTMTQLARRVKAMMGSSAANTHSRSRTSGSSAGLGHTPSPSGEFHVSHSSSRASLSTLGGGAGSPAFTPAATSPALGVTSHPGSDIDDLVAHLTALSNSIASDFFAPCPSSTAPPPGSRHHPSVWPMLENAGPGAISSTCWPELLGALKAVTSTRIKIAGNPALLNYLTFFSTYPTPPPRRQVPVDFQGLPDFLQLPHQHAEIIDLWWNHHRLGPLQPFSVVSNAISEYLRPDPLARDLWHRYVQGITTTPTPGPAAVWQSEDLGTRLDMGQHLTPGDLASMFPADAHYDSSIGDWLIWRLLGWLYLALETENQLYAMRKQLPISEHAKPIALVQSAMNQLRARYGYTRDMHSRLAQLALKLVHRAYPLFTPRFHQVTHFLNSVHAMVADILAKPYLDADPTAWRRVHDAVCKAVRGWSQAHAIALPPDFARQGGDLPAPSDLAPMLARVATHAAPLAGRFLINPVAMVRDPSVPEAHRWMGMPVATTAVAPATSLVLPASLLDALARVLAACPAHPCVQVLYGVTIVQGHWALVSEPGVEVADVDGDRSQLDVIAEWSASERVELVRGVLAAVWMLASAGIHVRCWPNGRPVKLVRVGDGGSGSGYRSVGVKLPLAEMIAAVVTEPLAAPDVPGLALFLRTLLQHHGGSALTALADDMDRASRECNPAKFEQFFLAASRKLAAATQVLLDEEAAVVDEHPHVVQRQRSSMDVASSAIRNSPKPSPVIASPKLNGIGPNPPLPPMIPPGGAPPPLSNMRTPSPGIGLLRNNTTVAAGVSSQYPSAASSFHAPVATVTPPPPPATDLHRRHTTGGAGSTGSGTAAPFATPADMDQLSHLVASLPLNSAPTASAPRPTSTTPAPPNVPAAATALPKPILDTWTRALAFYRHGQGDLSAAFNLFNDVSDAIPAALFYMGEILYYGSKTSGLRQDTAQAGQFYARARANGCAIACVGLGDCEYFGFLTGKSDVAQAKALYEEALRVPVSHDLSATDPWTHPIVTLRTLARAWAGLGDCHYRKNEYERARECYEQAVAMDPGPGGLPLPGVSAALAPDAGVMAKETELLGMGAGCRKAHARLAELYIHGQGGAVPAGGSGLDLEAAKEYLKRARGCRREVLAKCAYLRAVGEARQADEYQDEYLWRYPLDY